MLDTVEINHVQHISFAQSRLTDAVSVILSELLSYEHPSNCPGFLYYPMKNPAAKYKRMLIPTGITSIGTEVWA